MIPSLLHRIAQGGDNRPQIGSCPVGEAPTLFPGPEVERLADVMKGTIFNAFEAYAASLHGQDAVDDLFDSVELETKGPFVGPGRYPASDLVAIVVAASDRFGSTPDELLFGFGRFAFPALAGSVPTLMEQMTTPVEFLLGVESIVHTEVRKLDPEAMPARLRVEQTGPDEVVLHYESDLGLFAFVEGILGGVGDWYEVDVTSDRLSVDGTNASFAVRFAPTMAQVV